MLTLNSTQIIWLSSSSLVVVSSNKNRIMAVISGREPGTGTKTLKISYFNLNLYIINTVWPYIYLVQVVLSLCQWAHERVCASVGKVLRHRNGYGEEPYITNSPGTQLVYRLHGKLSQLDKFVLANNNSITLVGENLRVDSTCLPLGMEQVSSVWHPGTVRDSTMAMVEPQSRNLRAQVRPLKDSNKTITHFILTSPFFI